MIKIIDKRLGEVGQGNIINHYRTFATYDLQDLPHLAKHWWNVVELDTGFTVIITDDDINIIRPIL